jgi:hypothetical protein
VGLLFALLFRRWLLKVPAAPAKIGEWCISEISSFDRFYFYSSVPLALSILPTVHDDCGDQHDKT